MNKTIIMTLAAALMVPAMANEDQPQVPAQAPACKQQPGRPGRHLNPERHKEMLEKFDADKDGKLSDEERKAAREAMKDAHGQRGDKGPRGPRPEGAAEGRPEGCPGNAEGRPGRPGPRFNPEQRKEMLEKFDADKDGKLSDEERKAAREAMKDAHGQRGDKGPRGPRPEGAAEGRPEGCPGNAEGRPGRPGPRFNPEQRKEMLEKFDADKDGKLSEEERKAAREAMKEAHGQRGDKGPRGPRAGKHGRPGAPAPEGTPAPAPAPEVAPAPADSVAE